MGWNELHLLIHRLSSDVREPSEELFLALHQRRARLWRLKDFSGEAHPPQNKILANAQVWKGQDSFWHHNSQQLIAAHSQEECTDRECLCFDTQHIYCLLTIPMSLEPPAGSPQGETGSSPPQGPRRDHLRDLAGVAVDLTLISQQKSP